MGDVLFNGGGLVAVEMDGNGTCTIEGKKYPAIGFGTYPLQNETCFKAVGFAAKTGYRIIDTATFYDNYESIAHALQKQPRDQFYLISKVWPNAQTAKKLVKDVEGALKRLNTSYLDAYLIHWPNHTIPIEETLTALDGLRKQGKIRHIGLSNVTVNHLRRAQEVGVPITWVQIEMHPFFYDAELLSYCQAHSIGVQAWAPLGRGRLAEDPLLKSIGQKHGKTAAQVALRWSLQHGCLPLPGSSSESHIEQNMAVLDFTLSAEEMTQIDKRAQNGQRTRIQSDRGMGFSDEFDFSYEECWPKKF